jgi:DNA-binding NarL/FixJ family response regulator
LEAGGQGIRVLLVEDHDVFRQALELLLGMQDNIEVVGTVSEGTAAVEACRELRPDVCVMDFRLPGMDGVDATAAVHAEFPEIAVVGLTASASSREVDAFMTSGAVACLRKDQELDEIVSTIVDAAGRKVPRT